MGTGTGTGTSQPTPPARGAPASSRPRCQPQSRLAHMPPQGFRNSQPPLPRQRGGGHRAHLQLPWRTWVAVGSPSAGTAAGHHHRASSALLPPASKIRPRQCWVSVEVLSLRACCRQRSAVAHGTHVQQHAKGTPLLQVLGHRSLPALSEQGCTPKPSSVPRRAHAIRGQAAGWHCQPHPLATPVPPRPAHPGAHPVGSAGMNHGNPRASPRCPPGRDGHSLWHQPYLALALGVAGELAACGRERGERISGGRRGGIAGGSPRATHMQGRGGGTPRCGAWSTLARGTSCRDMQHTHVDAHTLHTHMHAPGGTSTAQHHMHMPGALGHAPMHTSRPPPPPVPTCREACVRANPSAQGLTA